MDPWAVGAGIAVVASLVIAIMYPPSRRWIAALAVVAIFGTAAVMVLVIGLISRMDVGGDLPAAAALGAVGLALVGLGLAAVIVLRGRRPAGT